MAEMNYLAAIVGRPNVGKSTLFNRLVGRREAIVDDAPGVTRDRLYGLSEWNGLTFSVVDTGGFVAHSDDVFEAGIRRQVQAALDQAELVLFVVDQQTGITDLDEAFAALLRRLNTQVLVVANKVDQHSTLPLTAEFYALGFEEVIGISANSGMGTGELMDAVVQRFRQASPRTAPDLPDQLPRLAIVGRPNAGKSTLANALLGEERTMVTDISGTTRDSIESLYRKYGKEFVLIDTAGLRRKSKVHDDLEFYATLRAIRAIEAADVCLVVLDGTQPVTAQDMNVLFVAQKRQKGIVVVVNKWDRKEERAMEAESFREAIRDKTAPFRDVPVLFVSALEKNRIYQAVEKALEVYHNRKKRIATHRLNEELLPVLQRQPPPAVKGKHIKIKYVMQAPTEVPTFLFYCNLPQYIREPYRRFLENQIRQRYAFTGVPINIFFRKK